MSKNATALRTFTHAGQTYAKGDAVNGLPANQLADFEGAGLVRVGTAAAASDDGPAKPTPSKATKSA